MRRYVHLAVIGMAIGLTGACGSLSGSGDAGTGGTNSGGHGGGATGGSIGSGGSAGGRGGTAGIGAGGTAGTGLVATVKQVAAGATEEAAARPVKPALQVAGEPAVALGGMRESRVAVEVEALAVRQEARERAAGLALVGKRGPVGQGVAGELAERPAAVTQALSATRSSGATTGMAVAAPATNQACARLEARPDSIARPRFAVATAMRIGAHARLIKPGWTRWRRSRAFRATAATACPAAWTPTARTVLSAA